MSDLLLSAYQETGFFMLELLLRKTAQKLGLNYAQLFTAAQVTATFLPGTFP